MSSLSVTAGRPPHHPTYDRSMSAAAESEGEPAESTAATVAQTERAALCDLFDKVGPHAPTLAGDWDTHHLAAHLSLRESNPVQLISFVLPGGARQAVDDLVATSDYHSLIDTVRSGPPPASLFSFPHLDSLGNTLEFFVHHEDVRRAQPAEAARKLSTLVEDQLWARIRMYGKVLLRNAPVGIELARTDAEDVARVSKKSDVVVVRGLPSELTLFAFGRSAVASVELDGSPRAVAAVRATKFSA